MKALLAQVVLVIFYCTNITVAIKTNDVNLCKRQPFRGRCPAADGKGPARSQFVLRYYMRDNECISYPFGHCANDENEPVLYRYKEECEKACLNKWPTNDQSTTIQNDHEIEKSANSLISSEITDNDKDNDNDNDNGINVQISTTSSSFPIIDNNNNNNNNNNTATISSQRAAFIAQKSTSHKLLTECEKRRQASESGLIKSDFIPICATDGTFRPLQCETQRENCFCVDHNGVKIPNSDSNGTKKPDCKRIIKAQKSLIYECLSPMDSGPCNTAIKRWYYDTRERQCIKFEYSGCGGNGNNYPTKEACEKQCKSTSNEPKCKGGLQPLRNENDQLVNCTESTCPNGYLCSVAQLGSVCCPINASSSATTNICQLPKERGPCDQYELRFYYNNRLGECKYFFFGGCEGNANNFERVEECERICRQRGVKITATSIVSAPQLITSGPQMRKLNKEFGIKNIKKTGEEKELVELISNDNDDNDDDDDDSAASTNISNDIKNINNDNTADTTTTTTTDNNNEANLEITSSTTIFHDGSMINKNLSAKSSINQSKSHQLQKIDQNIEKKIKQKGAKLSLDSNHTDKITDFTTVKTKNTIATIDKSEKFTTSNRNEQKLASESVAITTDQQLSQSDEEMKIITSTTKTTVESLSDTFMSTALASSIALSPSTIIITTTSQSILSTTAQPTANSNDRCFQKFDRGTCTGQFIRWYWDFEKSTCQVFTYSGCGGNGNNYRSREDCFAACHQPPQPTPKLDNICEHSIHPGDCTGIFQRFAFDSTINDCRPFTYTGCGGNGNNFGSSLECRNRCIVQKPTLSTDVCKHPIEVGECSGVFPRFAYDLVANECRPFTYGGCGGNGNNFGSMLECKTKCVQGSDELVKCPTIDASLCVEPCILFTNRQGCHECKCPIAHSEIDNEPIEPSVITSTLISDKSSDESKSLEAEQFIENKVEKKHGSMSHSGRTSQTNSVTELGEKCSQPMDAGPCKNFIERWFFNINTSLCQSFQYGGCAGNRNHFFSKHECEIHCARFFSEINEILKDQTTMNDAHEEEVIMESEILNQQNITTDSQVMQVTTPHAVVHAVTSLQLENDEICLLPPDAGPCHDYVLRWFHNSQTAKCEQFSYSSCGGNNNNFPDRHTCEAKCSHDNSIKSQLPERCTYKKDEGYSNGYNVKWYFNVRNLRCEQMVYKGQGGNSNQFETLGECQTFCIPLDDKVPEMDTTAKQIAHSLKSTSVDVHQRGFAASQDPENEQQQQQQALSITETDKMSEGQHHVQDITQNTNERHRSSIVSDKNSINVEKIQPINSKQLLTQTITPAELIPQNLDRSASETINARESSKQQLLSSFNDQNSKQISGKEINNAKTFGATIVNKNNDAIVDLPNIFDDISHTPSCPNGHKPIQHADGRPMMCLPGRNQCAGNSLCYFNGVDFFCCPNAEDPYDEHVFGGYGGEEVKRGYKNVKKTPINGNELIVRKLRLRREAQMSSSRPLAMNVAARIDSKVPKYSLARASFAVNNSSDTRQITNICMQDVNTGKCTEAHLRFFYDRRVNTCRLFYYSGCGGNENNFATEEECQQQCKSDKAYDEDVSPGSCPYGEPPLGDNAPVICGKDAGSFECPKGYYCRMGPPNVCCLEKLLPVSEKILVTKKHHENIRFAQPKVKTSENVGYQFDEKQKENDAENSPLAITSTNICPDGTDALLDESTQQPLKCGLGYDGQSFCPVGYYCSIDSEKNGRLCCQLGVVGVKIPPPPKIPPYFGLRPSNPGEIIPRGSLPSDYVSLKQQATGISNTAEPSEQYQSHLDLSGKKLTMNVQPISDSNRAEEDAIEPSENLIPSDEQTTDSSGNVVPSDSKLQDDIYGRMMLKSNDQAFRTQALYNAINNVASPEAENNEVQIDIGEMKDPFESLEYAQKSTSDRSICLLKPSEGRTCREDESPPRTNLQYFYSNRDKRCKLYFYRGCGGSQNRFDTKRHCELTCAGV